MITVGEKRDCWWLNKAKQNFKKEEAKLIVELDSVRKKLNVLRETNETILSNVS